MQTAVAHTFISPMFTLSCNHFLLGRKYGDTQVFYCYYWSYFSMEKVFFLNHVEPKKYTLTLHF